jgi:hypothetical protein
MMCILDNGKLKIRVHYYLPHYPVIKDSSLTVKLTVLFHATAKSSSGVLLRDEFMVEPIVQ